MQSRFYGWEDLHALSNQLARRVLDAGRPVDTIVGIARTGLLPAMLAAFVIDTRNVLTISVRTTATDIPSEQRLAPVIGSHLMRHDVEGRHCLLVDDVVDTGATMNVARRALEELGAASVTTAALIWSRVAFARNGQTGPCPADFWVEELDVWAAVPWEPTT